MRPAFPVTLTLPTDLGYLSLLNAFLRDLALRAGFAESEAMKIQLGAEETFANIIEHDFSPGAIEPISVSWEIGPLGATLRFRHKGQPFDPELFPQLDKEELETQLTVKGLGTFLMKKLMNEVQYNNLGHAGQELVLIKYLDQPREVVSESEPSEDSREAPVQKVSYDVRPLKPEEGVEVARLAYLAYSYSYPYEHIYFPDRVKKLNADGQLRSYVAVTEGQEIIAHSAIVYDASWPGVAELGVAFTKATHRGLGCLNALFDALIVHAGKAGDHGLLVTGVTTHPFSQKTALKYGLKECALMLSKTPSISFQNIDDRQVQRENLMLFFRFMEARGRVEVFVPPHHRTMIGRLYQELGEELRCMELPEPILADEPSQLDVTTNPGSLYAEIKVKQAGRRVVDEVHLALRQLCINRFETIFLKLDLASPSTALLCAAYEKLGFFFAGILPQRDGHDLLVLQYLNNQRPDYEAISVASDLGRDLLAYVRSQDASQAVR